MSQGAYNSITAGERPLSEFSPSVRLAVHQLGVDAATAEVVAALEAEGIRSLLIKGPAITRWLYEAPATRPYQDIDLLVSPSDQAPAARVLHRLGFKSSDAGLTPEEMTRLSERGEDAEHATHWSHTSRISVDLHRTIPGVGVGAAKLWDALAAGTDSLTVSGREVDIPSEAGRALIVGLQAGKGTLTGPKELEDLGRAVAIVRQPVWREAARLAERLRAVPAFAAGLRLLPEGKALTERLGLGREMDVETALRAHSAPSPAFWFQRLAEARGLRRKAAIITREVVPSKRFMRHQFPIARRGIAGLVLAYIWRPLMLLRRVGGGFAAWRRARREAAS